MDYVLVFSKISQRGDHHRSEALQAFRKKFLANLLKEGLEYEIDGDSDEDFCFVKLYAGRSVVEKYCELLKWKMPVKTNVLHRRDLVDKKFASNRRAKLFDDSTSYKLFSTLPPSRYRIHYEYSRAKRYL